ncbi:ABC transporter substrate-binding protein [Bordetella sp. BOR01]|uniref:ABC transporter substrate-binding protein n=1 Tax=Bordetella sp. BOR01 TaxID=2854779 RepID=UPI001C474331|nr:ABC transporter substrate-binding protein [Bordetella sp. BOR01]MBV7483904.1 ABC transporter substrate-binding protein [Bordetella sp. BOR01]
MRINRILTAASLAVGTALSLNAHAQAPACELDRPMKFGGMNWESNLMLVGVQRYIVEHGYGCQTAVEQGDTLPMFAALQRGDVDINTEIWITQMQKPWDEAIASGKIKQVGSVFTGTDGWYVPRYTAEKFPQLRNAADLKGLHEAFIDAEDPDKGRIYGCAVGWTCGTINANLLKAFKLQDEYLVYSPGNAAAQRAAISSAYKRKKDIVFYYWTPTSLIGSLDLVKLKLPPVDEKALACITDPQCQDPQPTGLASYPVVTAVNSAFAQRAPQLTAFLARVNVPEDVLTKTLGHMERESLEIEDASLYFLQQYPQIWRKWVPEDVAARVQQALAG